MHPRIGLLLAVTPALLVATLFIPLAPACCPAPPSGKPVVNADQTVIIIWDAAAKTQHFIRQATFKSEADDFGFLIPSPSQPELDESGNEAFPFLITLTAPEKQKMARPNGGLGCGCSAPPKQAAAPQAVRVLEEKLVAGFHAAVLEATTADALIGWLKEHGYAYSPAIAAWAKPYVQSGWKITALKVAKDASSTTNPTVATASLRLSFKTDRPLFPYREPDSGGQADAVGAEHRLLRIYFAGETRYEGELTKDHPWGGKVAWAGKLSSESRERLLQLLRLPPSKDSSAWWLTEFEDNWPYAIAPADLYFSRAADQNPVKRPPIVEYVGMPLPMDFTVYALTAALVILPLSRRLRWLSQG